MKVFADSHIKKHPKIRGKAACPWFYTKVYCFSNCRNTRLHILSKDLPVKTKAAYGNYYKLCQSK